MLIFNFFFSMYLFIDTTDPIKSKIGLINPDGSFADKIEWTGFQNQSEELLSNIDDLLLNHSLTLAGIEKIVVITGPGSYTGLRVGVASANALAFASGLPIIGLKESEWHSGDLKILLSSENTDPAKAYYLKPPHITKVKRHRHKK